MFFYHFPSWNGLGASTIPGQRCWQGMCAVCATPCSCTVWCRRGLRRRPGEPCLYPRGDPGNEDVQKCHGLSSLYPFRLPQNMRISSYFIAPILPPHLGTCWNTRCCVSAAKLLQLWFGVTARRESWELRVRRCKDTCGSMLRRQWSMPFQCKEESHFRTT